MQCLLWSDDGNMESLGFVRAWACLKLDGIEIWRLDQHLVFFVDFSHSLINQQVSTVMGYVILMGELRGISTVMTTCSAHAGYRDIS